MDLHPIDLIVIPRDFAVSIVTLLHNDDKYDHPSANQMLELTKRKFFIFDIKKVAQEVFNNCIKCMADKKIRPMITNLETQTRAECPGTFLNADVLKRNKQKILVLRDNLTSFTQTKFVPSESKDDLRSGLISLTLPFKPKMKAVIRVDPHSSFESLSKDKTLEEFDIELEIGDEKNINHNGVAEKAIQELEEEILKIPNNHTLTDITLAKVTNNLNSRIRHTKRSAKELMTKRDQYTGHDILVNDEDISNKQHERRSKDNDRKIRKVKKKGQDTKYEVGYVIYIISDKDKTQSRSPYVITEVKEHTVTAIKSKPGSKNKSYNIKTENIFKAIPNQTKDKVQVRDDYSSDETELETVSLKECFYCKSCRYKDFHHDKNQCVRYQQVRTKTVVAQDTKYEYSSSDSENDHDPEDNIPQMDELDILTDGEEEMEEVQAEHLVNPVMEGPEEDVFPEVQAEHSDNPVMEGPEDDVLPQFRDPPKYKKPKRGDQIQYYNADTDGFVTATITSNVKGYKNVWFNIKRDDSSKGSVELSEDTLWRFVDVSRNAFYNSRWGQVIEDMHLPVQPVEDDHPGDEA